MSRPGALTCLALAACALAFAGQTRVAEGQPKVARLGYLGHVSTASANLPAFKEGLRAHGWVEGQNLLIEYRYGGDDYDRMRALAAELVGLKVDVIVAPSAPTAKAAKEATRTIPIVFHTLNDPVLGGLVTSFARPGGNLTGNAGLGPELDRKRMELLKELVPSLSVVTALVNPSNPMTEPRLKVIDDAARVLKVKVQVVRASDARGLAGALETLGRARPAGLIVFEDPMLSTQRSTIIDFAARQRLPVVYTQSGWAAQGGLIEYAPNQPEMYRQLGAYVDRILRGARPADLPVEQPSKYEMIVNLKTARAVGLTVPPAVLLRADQVIE
jgi:putative ABC transport system substrate-binding protein